MRKVRNRKLALLLVLTMLATLFVAIPSASAAASSYTAVTKITKFDAGDSSASTVTGATVQVKIDPAIATASTANIEVLDSKGAQLDIASVVYTGSANVSAVLINGSAPTAGSPITVNAKKFSLSMTPTGTDEATINLYVTFDGSDAAAGEVKMNFFGTTQQLDAGSVVIAQAVGGQLTVALISSVPSITEDVSKSITLRVTPSVSGAFGSGDQIKVKLPAGFAWGSSPSDDGTYVSVSRDSDDYRLLIIEATANQSAIFDVTATVSVDDEDTAKMGDVVATVEGVDCTVTTSEITVANYGDYDIKASVASVKDVRAGILEEKTDKITIEETIQDSIIDGRKVTIELPEWVKIMDVTDESSDYTSSYATSENIDDNKLTFVAGNKNNDTRKYEFKLKLSVEAGRSGDITATISGAGISEKSLVIAKAVPAVTASATATDVKIGVQAQSAPDLTISEGVAGSIQQGTNRNISIVLPEGVKFAATPTVEVTSGDIALKTDQAKVTDSVYTSDGTVSYGSDRVFSVPVKSESLKASTIKISNIKLTLDRTVPEGDLKVKVAGWAVVENYGSGDYEFLTGNAAEAVLANCITPAPGDTKATTVLVAGSTTMKVNGADVIMDVAPYLKNSRLFVSVRFAAQALGVDSNNILWDQATKTATLMTASGRVIQMTVGSKVMTVNGAKINMDVAPEMLSNRVMLPVGWLAQALGATATWDGTTSTATLEL